MGNINFTSPVAFLMIYLGGILSSIFLARPLVVRMGASVGILDVVEFMILYDGGILSKIETRLLLLLGFRGAGIYEAENF
jgi:hypothetical protein